MDSVSDFYNDKSMIQSKCTEAILELNHCIEVSHPQGSKTISYNTCIMLNRTLQEILRANASVKTAADLATKYRKNVQYNLEATKGNETGTTQ